MRFLRRTGTAAALWVAGVGIAVGGVGLAGAVGDAPGPDASESASAAAGDERGHMAGGRRDHGAPGGGPGRLAAGLAGTLDLEESDVAAALAAALEQLEPTESTDAGRAGREEHQTRLAAALAAQLDATEEEIVAALESMGEERRAAGRTTLAERLDGAVRDGDLTAADRASVLKALDAGVLGAERRGR